MVTRGLFVLFANAETGGAGAGSQNRRGSGNNFTRGANQRRRGPETMGQYYARLGTTGFGRVTGVNGVNAVGQTAATRRGAVNRRGGRGGGVG